MGKLGKNELLMAALIVLLLLSPNCVQLESIAGDEDDDGCGWDGECTQEIEDECCEDCMDVRMCSGQLVDNPLECFTNYCSNDNHWCEPVYQEGSRMYKCTCSDLDEWDNPV